MPEPFAAFEQGPIRPPNEAFSLLVRVTRNCPWNRCAFCPVYKGRRFALRETDAIVGDIEAMASVAAAIAPLLGPDGEVTTRAMEQLRDWGSNEAVQVVRFLADGGRTAFLQDANSLIMPADDLAAVLGALRRAFPSIERVTTYARSHTVTRRSAEELAQLRSAGLDRVHVGIESGADEVLAMVDKGATAARHIEAGRLVKAAGMELSAYVMPGLGGRALSAMHATETAAVLREVDPHFVRLRSLAVAAGTPLATACVEGRFALLDEIELAREIRALVEGLTPMTSVVRSDHALNLLEEVEGQLPHDRPRMLAVIDRFLALAPDEQDTFVVGRLTGMMRHLDDLADLATRQRAEEVRRGLEERLPGPVRQVARQLMARLM
jgi:hypothetical protein